MTNIKRSSVLIRSVLQFLFAVIPVLFILYWFNAPEEVGLPSIGFTYSFLPQGIQVLHEFTAQDRMLGFLIGAIPIGITMAILLALIQLFRLYEGQLCL